MPTPSSIKHSTASCELYMSPYFGKSTFWHIGQSDVIIQEEKAFGAKLHSKKV